MADATAFPEVAGVRVSSAEEWRIASLRYFTATGASALALHAALGVELPPPLTLGSSADGQWLLAWRSPKETLCLTRDGARADALSAALASLADGQLIELSAALAVFCVTGPHTRALLARLTGPDGLPATKQARRSRMADVAVLTLAPDPEEWLLVVDRAYAAHLSAWLDATLRDFQP
jgi:heterotetrameric sarcosine oxidase gamma subunit